MPLLAALVTAVVLPQQVHPVPFRVVAVSPTQNKLNVPRTSAITITFNQPVNPDSVNQRTISFFGKWSAMIAGQTQWLNGGRTLHFQPNRPLSPAEVVFVSVAKGLRSDKGTYLTKGFTSCFWVASRASSVQFTKHATLIPGVTPYGAYGGDQDGDGDCDLFITNESTQNACVFLNDGAANFTSAQFYPAGRNCSPNEPADLNFDGKLDMVVANILDNDVSVFFGNGNGTFQPQVRYPMGSQPRGLALLDVECDGDMDIVTANRGSSNLTMRLNNGDGTFGAQTIIDGGMSGETAVGACDMNNDGIFDLVVGGYSSNQLAVLLGNGNGGFSTPTISQIGSRPWMIAWGDANGDGYVDAAAALSNGSAVGVAMNDKTGKLGAGTSYSTAVFPIAVDFGDYNGDGWLDLAVANYGGSNFSLWANQGNGTFGSKLTIAAEQAGSCTTLHDLDGDGDVDLTLIDEIADKVWIYLQQG